MLEEPWTGGPALGAGKDRGDVCRLTWLTSSGSCCLHRVVQLVLGRGASAHALKSGVEGPLAEGRVSSSSGAVSHADL